MNKLFYDVLFVLYSIVSCALLSIMIISPFIPMFEPDKWWVLFITVPLGILAAASQYYLHPFFRNKCDF